MSQAMTASQYDLVLAGPTGSLDSYIQTVKALPVLDKEQEQALARRLVETDDIGEWNHRLANCGISRANDASNAFAVNA